MSMEGYCSGHRREMTGIFNFIDPVTQLIFNTSVQVTKTLHSLRLFAFPALCDS